MAGEVASLTHSHQHEVEVVKSQLAEQAFEKERLQQQLQEAQRREQERHAEAQHAAAQVVHLSTTTAQQASLEQHLRHTLQDHDHHAQARAQQQQEELQRQQAQVEAARKAV